MGWWSKRKPRPLAEAPTVDPEFLSKVEANRVLEERERLRDASRVLAWNAVDEARTWLENHPNTHSARRGDVRRLINAVESLDALLASTNTYDVLHEGLTANQKVAEGIV